jgi:multidrug resistance efflux pump
MYKEEELTTATADIVVKRALRQLEMSKEFLSMTKETAEKSKTLDHAVARQKMVDAVDKARQGLEQLKVAQRHGQATRESAVVTAQLALTGAEKKAAELKQDLESLTVKAPFDGKLIYGQLADGQWKGGDPRTLRPGEKVAADTVLMSLAPPQNLQLAINVPEPALGWVTPGMKATVIPLSWPDLKLTGTTSQAAPAGKGEGAQQTFKMLITFDQSLDARIEPGRKASVRIAGPKAMDVLVLPVKAVSGGVVKVRTNGETVEKAVTLGRSDGELIEITGGLSEGDAVVMENGE